MSNDIDKAREHIRETEKALRELLAKQVAEANAAFEAMTPEQKRVHIAQDTMQQIQKGWITVQRGTYLDWDGGDDYEPGEECRACALGSIFAACIARPELKLKAEPGYEGDDNEQRVALSPYFSEEQLMLIESAFEMDDFTYGDDGWEDAVDFGRMFNNDKDRLLAILQNIIDNNGEFVPHGRPA